MQRRLLLLVPAAFVLTGCETLQEAEPVGKTVPVAALIGGAWALVVMGSVSAVSRMVRRNRDAHVVRWPAWTAALAVAPALIVGTAVMSFLTWAVAFEYRDAHYSLFSWEDTVGIAGIVGGLFAVGIAVSLGVVALLVARSPRLLIAGQVVLVTPVAIGLLAGLGDPAAIAVAGWSAPWLPALVLSCWRARPAEPDLTDLPIPGRQPAPSEPPVRC